MKAVIVYEGVHGPTEVLARVICDEIEQAGQGVEVHPIEEFQPGMLQGADIVFLGSPTRHGRAVDRARTLANIIGELCPMDVVAAAFDTEVQGRSGAADKLEEQFRQLGLTITEPGRFLLANNHAQLAEGEIEHAREWTHLVMRTVAA